jgi:HK97 family phage prohead protease
MPLPKPNDGESQDDFISRCMSNDTMKDEFPDTDQRLAVCHRRWDDKGENSIAPDELRYAIERRYYEPVLEMREDGDSNTLTGYAAVFNSWSEDLGFFKERIAPGAFQKTIKENDIRALINHDPNLIIGRTKNKTLRLWEDDKGLGFEVDLPETTYAMDLRASIKRKDITQNSFGFMVVQDEWDKDNKRRTLREVQLFDISPVTFPAYKQTSVKVRLQRIGIDPEALDIAIVRANIGNMTDKDEEVIHGAIDILERYVPQPSEPLAVTVTDNTCNVVTVFAPSGTEHSDVAEGPDDASTLIRMRVALTRARANILRR